LQWLYKAAINKPQTVELLMEKTEKGVRFIHLLALSPVDKQINMILDDFLTRANVEEGVTAKLVNTPSDIGTPLQILSSNDRPDKDEPNEGRFFMVSRLMKDANPGAMAILDSSAIMMVLDAVLYFGQQQDLAKAMAGVPLAMLNPANGEGLARWAYKNRDSQVLNGENANPVVPALYAAEYQRRFDKKLADDMKEMREGILFHAVSEGSIGNKNEGAISVISRGFLPKEAFNEPFSFLGDTRGRGTMLFSLLHLAAKAKVVKAIAISQPDDETFADSWDDAGDALQIMLHNGGQEELRERLSSPQIADIAFRTMPKCLAQADIKALAQALKAYIPEGWDQMCRYAQNSEHNDMHLWQLINLIGAENKWTDDSVVKTPPWLDYQ